MRRHPASFSALICHGCLVGQFSRPAKPYFMPSFCPRHLQHAKRFVNAFYHLATLSQFATWPGVNHESPEGFSQRLSSLPGLLYKCGNGRKNICILLNHAFVNGHWEPIRLSHECDVLGVEKCCRLVLQVLHYPKFEQRLVLATLIHPHVVVSAHRDCDVVLNVVQNWRIEHATGDMQQGVNCIEGPLGPLGPIISGVWFIVQRASWVAKGHCRRSKPLRSRDRKYSGISTGKFYGTFCWADRGKHRTSIKTFRSRRRSFCASAWLRSRFGTLEVILICKRKKWLVDSAPARQQSVRWPQRSPRPSYREWRVEEAGVRGCRRRILVVHALATSEARRWGTNRSHTLIRTPNP